MKTYITLEEKITVELDMIEVDGLIHEHEDTTGQLLLYLSRSLASIKIMKGIK